VPDRSDRSQVVTIGLRGVHVEIEEQQKQCAPRLPTFEDSRLHHLLGGCAA
jgi:hypothetical protein